MNLHSCPACGLFGRKLRRRNRDAADAALVAFHHGIVAAVRAERKRGLLMAAYSAPYLDPWQRQLLGQVGDQRDTTVVVMPPQRPQTRGTNYFAQWVEDQIHALADPSPPVVRHTPTILPSTARRDEQLGKGPR